MKIIVNLLTVLSAIALMSASTETTPPKRSFEKIVFLELDLNQDSVLFMPYSKAWDERWQGSADLLLQGSEMMNSEKYKAAFKDRTDNLWTILHPLIIEGKVQVYYPYEPDSYGMGVKDDGELRYPVMDDERTETFLTSEEIREQLCLVLGLLGPMYDIPLVDDYGDPLIMDLPDGTQSFIYASPEYYWYADQQIIKYKLRVRIEVNKKGKEKKRVIEAFCPVVNRTTDSDQVIGEADLLWFEFDELKPTLKTSYFLTENWKPISYYDYLLERLEKADFRPQKK